MATKADIYAELKGFGVTLTSSQLKKVSKPELEKRLADKIAEIKAEQKRRPPRSSAMVDVDAGSPDADVAPSSNVKSMNRSPRPAALFRPTALGSKRDHMARLVLRPEGATVEQLMEVTGWSRSTTSGAITEDLVRGMGLGVRRQGASYFGRLPDGVTSHVREVAQTRMAANTSPDPKPTVYPYDPDERGEDKLLTRNACMARAEIWTIKNQKHGTPETGDISHDGKSVLSTLTDLHTLTINRKTGGVRLSKPVQV